MDDGTGHTQLTHGALHPVRRGLHVGVALCDQHGCVPLLVAVAGLPEVAGEAANAIHSFAKRSNICTCTEYSIRDIIAAAGLTKAGGVDSTTPSATVE